MGTQARPLGKVQGQLRQSICVTLDASQQDSPAAWDNSPVDGGSADAIRLEGGVEMFSLLGFGCVETHPFFVRQNSLVKAVALDLCQIGAREVRIAST